MLSFINSKEITYLSSSSDTPCQSDEDQETQAEWFTLDFLDEIKYSGILNHRLKLKAGVTIMLLGNIDQSKCLCNDTRL